MKTISKISAIALCMITGVTHVMGNEPSSEVGFLRIINAITQGYGTTRVFIDGEDLYPKGYQLGQRSGGIGLGLAVVRQIVAAHQGEISVGESAMQGAEFRLLLPMKETP